MMEPPKRLVTELSIIKLRLDFMINGIHKFEELDKGIIMDELVRNQILVINDALQAIIQCSALGKTND